jgi:hypothetical protein
MTWVGLFVPELGTLTLRKRAGMTGEDQSLALLFCLGALPPFYPAQSSSSASENLEAQ